MIFALLQIASQQLASGFGDMFRAGLDGWEAFGQAAKNTIKNIIAQLAAKAALFVLLNVLTGGTATAGCLKYLPFK